MGSKRGTQTELLSGTVTDLRPGLCTWGLSATLGQPEHAMRQLCGEEGLIQAELNRPIELSMLAPDDWLELPWAGHYGLTQLRQVAPTVCRHPSLVFTNTRAQAETWFDLRTIRFDLLDRIALHHGSLDREERETIEAALKAGELACVVCTSSLDLGVDFSPLEQVFQIGSVKGIARLIQRAGRAAHRWRQRKAVLRAHPRAAGLRDSGGRPRTGAERCRVTASTGKAIGCTRPTFGVAGLGGRLCPGGGLSGGHALYPPIRI